MASASISVPEVHCQHCIDAIEGALSATDGVGDSTVDLRARTVTVSWRDGACDLADLVTVIEDQGYEVTGATRVLDDAGADRS